MAMKLCRNAVWGVGYVCKRLAMLGGEQDSFDTFSHGCHSMIHIVKRVRRCFCVVQTNKSNNPF